MHMYMYRLSYFVSVLSIKVIYHYNPLRSFYWFCVCERTKTFFYSLSFSGETDVVKLEYVHQWG